MILVLMSPARSVAFVRTSSASIASMPAVAPIAPHVSRSWRGPVTLGTAKPVTDGAAPVRHGVVIADAERPCPVEPLGPWRMRGRRRREIQNVVNMNEDLMAEDEDWLLPRPTVVPAVHRLWQAKGTLFGKAIRVGRPNLDAATSYLFARGGMIEALKLRVRIEKDLERLRLPCVGQQSFDAEAHLEWEGAHFRVHRARPREELRFCAIEVDPLGLVEHMVSQPVVREEDEVAVWLEDGDLIHVLSGDEQLLAHLLTEVLTARIPSLVRTDNRCDGGAPAVLLLFYRHGRTIGRGSDDSIGTAVWVALWEVARGWHGVRGAEGWEVSNAG